MPEKNIIALNRIVYPSISLPDFIKLASELGVHKIELRNDILQKNVLDSYSPEKIRNILEEEKVRVITINALQNFNVAEIFFDNLKELKTLIKTAKEINCSEVVFCPSNSGQNREDDPETYKTTLSALIKFSPVLEENNMKGLIEPLGFPTSSLRSISLAQKLIRESGCRTYKIVHDTFHFYLGTDSMQDLLKAYDKSLIGLVHVSSAAKSTPTINLKDGDRVLPDMVDRQDILNSREQIKALADIGYRGDISFEAFSNKVQELNLKDFKKHINNSIDFLYKPLV